jgi:hypothetical protein
MRSEWDASEVQEAIGKQAAVGDLLQRKKKGLNGILACKGVFGGRLGRL